MSGEPDRAPGVRLSDEDRDRAVTELKNHYASGRLDAGELAERTHAVLRARTWDEVAAVVGDLPVAASVGPLRFRDHAFAFVGVNVVLLALWAATRDPSPAATDAGAGNYWPVWVLGIWSLLLVAHALLAQRLSHQKLRSGPPRALRR
jgi:hypothetical protein